MSVCMCVRERERGRENVCVDLKYFLLNAIAAFLSDHLGIYLDLKMCNRQEIVSVQ